MMLDDWIVVESVCDHTVGLLASVREEIEAALVLKSIDPAGALPPRSERILATTVKVMKTLARSPTSSGASSAAKKENVLFNGARRLRRPTKARSRTPEDIFSWINSVHD
jgi:hypothetical protein